MSAKTHENRTGSFAVVEAQLPTPLNVKKGGRGSHHFPAKCSVMIAMNLSKLPRMARWIITGLEGGLSADWKSSGERYFKLKRSGSWKSSWMVAHWNDLRSASRMVISILGP